MTVVIADDGAVGKVPLCNGRVAYVDPEDAPKTSLWQWQSHQGYALRGTKNRKIYLHREILGVIPIGMMADHKDGNPLNCRRLNLRFATRPQNNRNTKRRSDNTSGFKGVCLHKPSGRWRAMITTDGKHRHLGYYESPEEAHVAYCQANRELHGEFGRTT